VSTPLLEVKDLHVSYGAVQALKGLSISVNKGEIVTLLGSNGAGKSTLLRAIMSMVNVKRGEIVYEGQSIKSWATDRMVKNGISLVPEGRGILATLTVEENLELGGYHQPDPRASFKEVFELFPICEQRLHQSAGTLSGGEQQMVAIGRALIARPRLLLLDEPSLGLAPRIIQNIFKLIEKIRESGVSILLIEQNVHMALKVADRGYVIQNGRVVMTGTAAELKANTEDTQAAYLGG
jgi:branched-chain amino acid transport system ATP-binding protein